MRIEKKACPNFIVREKGEGTTGKMLTGATVLPSQKRRKKKSPTRQKEEGERENNRPLSGGVKGSEDTKENLTVTIKAKNLNCDKKNKKKLSAMSRRISHKRHSNPLSGIKKKGPINCEAL